MENESGIVTTQEEIEGYLIIKAILCSVVDPARVVMRDRQTYCGILLDDNNRKPLCRMHFNSVSVKYIGTFDADKNETKHKIEKLDDIYQYADLLRTTVAITLENSKRHIQMKQNLGSGLIIPNEVKTGYLKTWRCRMRTLFYLSESQMERISPFFPRSHGIPRADGRHVVSGILYVIKHGLQWKDAPAEYGPYKTLYNRFVRLSRLGVFSRIFTELANQTPFDGSLMIDSTHLKAHRTAASLRKKGAPRVS